MKLAGRERHNAPPLADTDAELAAIAKLYGKSAITWLQSAAEREVREIFTTPDGKIIRRTKNEKVA